MVDAVLIAGAYPDARFLNADEIQREGGFSNALAAGRELIAGLRIITQAGGSFAIETTLSSVSYAHQFAAWRARGYWVTIHYLEVVSADFAVARVAKRVAAGGHDVPEPDIRRRHDPSGLLAVPAGGGVRLTC